MRDQTIIELFFRRSEDAIRNVSQKYGRYLMKIALNILRRYQDGEECVNDTYLTAWNQIPPDHPENLLPYLGRITRCLALNRHDYLTAHKRSAEFEVQLSELEECLPANNSVWAQFEESEAAAEISAFLKAQKKEERNVFIRRYWFSDSISEIAAHFHMSESKVKSMLFRIRNRLRQHLESEGYHI